MAKFVVRTINGKEYHSIELHDYGDSKEPSLGSALRYDITKDQEGLSISELQKLYVHHTKPHEWERDQELKFRMMARLREVISLSRDENEVKLAMAQYKKLTGKDFQL